LRRKSFKANVRNFGQIVRGERETGANGLEYMGIVDLNSYGLPYWGRIRFFTAIKARYSAKS
jgi:hypothetical protein